MQLSLSTVGLFLLGLAGIRYVQYLLTPQKQNLGHEPTTSLPDSPAPPLNNTSP
jgi:hypothetical protein